MRNIKITIQCPKCLKQTAKDSAICQICNFNIKDAQNDNGRLIIYTTVGFNLLIIGITLVLNYIVYSNLKLPSGIIIERIMGSPFLLFEIFSPFLIVILVDVYVILRFDFLKKSALDKRRALAYNNIERGQKVDKHFKCVNCGYEGDDFVNKIFFLNCPKCNKNDQLYEISDKLEYPISALRNLYIFIIFILMIIAILFISLIKYNIW